MYVDLLSSSLITTDASPPPLLIVTNDKSFWELLKLIVKDSESLSVTSLLVMLMNTDTDVVFAGNNMSLLTGIKSETGGGGGKRRVKKEKEGRGEKKSSTSNIAGAGIEHILMIFIVAQQL